MAVQTREQLRTVAGSARNALDNSIAIVGEKAKSYASKGAARLGRARDRIPTQLRKPSMTMVLTALGAGLLAGLLLSGKATRAVGDLSEAGKDALRRRRLNKLPH